MPNVTDRKISFIRCSSTPKKKTVGCYRETTLIICSISVLSVARKQHWLDKILFVFLAIQTTHNDIIKENNQKKTSKLINSTNIPLQYTNWRKLATRTGR